ncbi:MAG: isoprenyl transferase [Syntrophales bacterium]
MVNIDLTKLPQHIAIIMDGNGRWAEKHALGRILGHRKGAEAVRVTVKTCREIGVKCLTLYAFSVENWLRPGEEVQGLMNLLDEFLHSELQEMLDSGIRLTTIGNIDDLRESLKNMLRQTIDATAHNTEMNLNLALSYGGRDEIIETVKKIVEDSNAGKIVSQQITKELFSGYLQTSHILDPDLLIRTSGEYRLSNFLLWQTAYTELYFTDVLWPDFGREDLFKAIAEYQTRERRFGLTSKQLKNS